MFFLIHVDWKKDIFIPKAQSLRPFQVTEIKVRSFKSRNLSKKQTIYFPTLWNFSENFIYHIKIFKSCKAQTPIFDTEKISVFDTNFKIN